MEYASSDIRFDVPLAEACFEDRQEFCANVPPGSARVIRCLQDRHASCPDVSFAYIYCFLRVPAAWSCQMVFRLWCSARPVPLIGCHMGLCLLQTVLKPVKVLQQGPERLC